MVAWAEVGEVAVWALVWWSVVQAWREVGRNAVPLEEFENVE